MKRGCGVMKAKKNACHKLKNHRGESIAEVLIALLVSSLGMLLLATMISASARVIRTSRDAMKNYMSSDNLIILQNESSDTVKILYGTITVKDSSDNNYALWDGGSSDIDAAYYRSTSAGNGYPVISYRKR